MRFLGGVHLGDDVTREDLLASYDAVVYATGAMRDRRMGIPGEDLPGSYAATDFVNWYCGHPDSDAGAFTLDAESVAVVGVGNVAVDVARILVRDPAELRRTDMPQSVLEALMASKVREVHMIGRRGPAQAKFTTKELRELGELSGRGHRGAAGRARPGPASTRPAQSAELADSDRRVRGNLAVIRDWAAREPAGGERRLTVRFWLRPEKIDGTERLSGLTPSAPGSTSRAGSPGPGSSRRSGARWCSAAWATRACRCPACRSTSAATPCPTPTAGCSAADGAPLPREYVAGWLKRGPTGVVGTNKSDAAATVRSLLADLAGGGRAPARGQSRDEFVAQLAQRGCGRSAMPTGSAWNRPKRSWPARWGAESG